MHVQAVREGQRRAGLHVRAELLAIQVALALIRGQHHHDVGPFGALGRVHDLQAGGLGLGHAGGAGAQADGEVLHAAVLQVLRMGVALAAVADDGDVLPLDQVHVGVAIVVDAHGSRSFSAVEVRVVIVRAPRASAAIPVRETSARPRSRIRSMKASSFSDAPVSSKTKLPSRGVDDPGAERIGDAQRLDPLLAGADHLHQRHFARDVRAFHRSGRRRGAPAPGGRAAP